MIREALDALDKATTGKWTVNENRAMVDSTDGFPICALAWPHAIRSEDETKANAARIAAAPEAIAWIKRALPFLEFRRKLLTMLIDDGFTITSDKEGMRKELAELDALLKEVEGA